VAFDDYGGCRGDQAGEPWQAGIECGRWTGAATEARDPDWTGADADYAPDSATMGAAASTISTTAAV